MRGFGADVTTRLTGRDANREREPANADELQFLSQLYEVSASCALPGNGYEYCLERILETAIAITEADKGNMQRLAASPEHLEIICQRGFDEAFLTYFSAVRRDAHAACGAACVTRQRVLVEDIATSEMFWGQAFRDVLIAAGVQAVQSTPLISSSGALLGMISTHFNRPHRPSDAQLRAMDLLARQAADYIERKQAEATLRESEAKYRTLFQSIDEGFCIIEQVSDEAGNVVDYRFVEVNQAFERQSGLAGVTGKLRSELAACREDFWRHLYDEVARTGMARRLQNFHGPTNRWYDVYVAPLEGSDPQRLGIVFNDITERRKTERALASTNEQLELRVAKRTRQLEREMRLREQAQAALAQSQQLESLGQLTGGIAHDFNNLLTVISGNLELAESKIADREARHAVQQAIDAVAMGANLNRQLLSFARRRKLAPERVNMNYRVGEMTQLLRRTLGEEIELELHLDGSLWPTRADPGEINSAIVNIAVNARDAMPTGGKLTIATVNLSLDDARSREVDAPPGDYVGLEITDTGHGMSPAIRRRAVEPFFTTKAAGKGTGLGLSSVHGFARQSGGFMEIASDIAIGTTIRICLPRVMEAAAAVGSATCEQDLPSGNAELVLVVEDNEPVRQVTLARLESLGYAVLEASNGPEAIEVLKAESAIELVLSDVVMPGGMSGYDIAAWVRSEKPGIKVMLASGHVDVTAVQPGEAAPNLLAKPYSRAALAHALREVLDAQ